MGGLAPRCPVCGARGPTTDVKVLLRECDLIGKLVEEVVSPGGRALTFRDGRVLLLNHQCSWCDAAEIREFMRRSMGEGAR